MANSLYQSLGNDQMPQNNLQQFMQQMNEFRRRFQGDPKQKVMELLNSGVMSQGQFNQLSQVANQIMGMFPR